MWAAVEKTWEDLAALSRHARAVGKILTSSDALLAVALGLDDSRGVLALGRWVVEAPSRQHPIAKAIWRMLAPVIASRAEHVGIRERWLEYVENAPSYGLLDETLVDPQCTAHLANLSRRVAREAIASTVAAMEAADRGLVLAPCSIAPAALQDLRDAPVPAPVRKQLVRTATLLESVLPRLRRVIAAAERDRRRIVQRVRDNLLACIDDFAAKLVPTAKCRIEADVWLWNGYVGEPGLAYAYGARGFEHDVHAALRRRCPITEWRKPTLTEVSGGVLTDQLGFSGAHVVSRCLAKVVAAVDPAGSELLPVAIAGHRGADYGVLHVLREVPGQLARTRRGAVGITKRRRLPAIFHLGGWPVPVVRDDLRRALEDAAPFPGVFNPLALRRSEA